MSARRVPGRASTDPRALLASLDGRAAIEWGVYGVPESFLVDAGGVIRLKHVGPLTPEVVEADLLPRLRETGPRPANGAE